MKILLKQIDIYNFRNRAGIDRINLEDMKNINLVCGHNGVGKSTAAAALKSLFWYDSFSGEWDMSGLADIDGTELDFNTKYENIWNYKLPSAGGDQHYYTLDLDDFVKAGDNKTFLDFIKTQTSGGINFDGFPSRKSNASKDKRGIDDLRRTLDSNRNESNQVEFLEKEFAENKAVIKDNYSLLEKIEKYKKYLIYLEILKEEAGLSEKYPVDMAKLTMEDKVRHESLTENIRDLNAKIFALQSEMDKINQNINISFSDVLDYDALISEISQKTYYYTQKADEIQKQSNRLREIEYKLEADFSDGKNYNQLFSDIEDAANELNNIKRETEKYSEAKTAAEISLDSLKNRMGYYPKTDDSIKPEDLKILQNNLSHKLKDSAIDKLIEELSSRKKSNIFLAIGILIILGLAVFTRSYLIGGICAIITAGVVVWDRKNNGVRTDILVNLKKNVSCDIDLEKSSELIFYINNFGDYDRALAEYENAEKNYAIHLDKISECEEKVKTLWNAGGLDQNADLKFLKQQYDLYREISDIKNTIQHLQEEYTDMEDGIKSLYKANGISSTDDLQKSLNNLNENYSRYKELCNGKKTLEDYEKRLTDYRNQINDIYSRLSVSSENDFNDRSGILDAYLADIKRIDIKRESIRDINISDIDLSQEEIIEKISLEDDLRESNKSLHESNGGLQNQIENCKLITNDKIISEIEFKRQDLQKEYNLDLERNFCAIACEAVKDECSKFASNVKERASEMFNKFTGNRYTVKFESDMKIKNGGGEELNMDMLSSGTKCQLLLATRLAYIEECEKDVMYPLFLDECLAECDDQTTEIIIRSLIEIASEGRQIFYFTAKSGTKDEWDGLVSDKDIYKIHVLT